MKSFVVAALSIFVLDLIWIQFLMNRFYRKQLGALPRVDSDGKMKPILWSAFLVYVLLSFGICFFVLPMSGNSEMAWGFLFGLIVYGVYDLTNYSVLKDWTLPMTVVDLIWGGVVCSLSTLAASLASKI